MKRPRECEPGIKRGRMLMNFVRGEAASHEKVKLILKKGRKTKKYRRDLIVLLRSPIRETRNNATFQADRADTHLRYDLGCCFDERSHGIQHPPFSRSPEYPLRPLYPSLLLSLFLFLSKYVIGNGELRERRRY